MRRQRGKKSSNEPGNASEEEAPDAGEQQPAEPQPDTTNIRDTQQQLQSHINQLQTDVNGMKSDMNGMKSDMATIKSLLQSLTNTQRLPSHRETQPTTTPTRVKSTQPTDIEETKEQPQEPAGSGQEEELDRFMEKLIRYADIENAVDEDLRRGHEKALELFDEYKDQITDPDKFVTLNKAPKMQELTHTVEFQPGARPHADRVIPMAPDVLPIFHEWHDRMVELGCIRKVTDEEKLQAKFLLGHLAILKRGATRPYDKTSYRFALNAVPANKWIIPAQDLKPPTYSEIAAFTKGKRVFSVIDVQQFFPSIPAHYPTIMHACKGSWYTYAVTIQGERNATAAAHRVLTHLAGDLISDGKLIAHVDDCLIATNTVEEHLDVLKTLFQKLVEYGLKINAKSIFVRPMVKFLGMLVHQEGVEPDLLRYNAVLLWPVPRTRVQVRKFVGFIQYFHKYIANCSQLLEPLHAIVNGKGRFQWSEAAQTAFDEVRAKLVNCSYLHHIDYETTKHIRVDAATGHGVGCALYQENEEGELVPLMFASRRFSDAEKNYGAGDAEMCAVYWAVTQAFHDIVQHAPIVIHTDHLNNVQILTSPTANSSKRRQRWAFYLGDYNIVEVRHVPGKDLIDADTLSRIDHIPSGATMETETSIGEMMAALQEIETRNNGNRPTMTKKPRPAMRQHQEGDTSRHHNHKQTRPLRTTMRHPRRHPEDQGHPKTTRRITLGHRGTGSHPQHHHRRFSQSPFGPSGHRTNGVGHTQRVVVAEPNWRRQEQAFGRLRHLHHCKEPRKPPQTGHHEQHTTNSSSTTFSHRHLRSGRHGRTPKRLSICTHRGVRIQSIPLHCPNQDQKHGGDCPRTRMDFCLTRSTKHFDARPRKRVRS